MSNDENKTQLIKLLLAKWQTAKYASRLHDRLLYFVCSEECHRLTSDDGVSVQVSPAHDLFSSQEEADTRMILHCYHISRSSSPSTVIVVRSPDTDVFLLLLRYSQDIDQVVLFDTGVGNKRRLLNVKDVISEKGRDLCTVLPALHSFTGCDTTSSFVRQGKIGPLKTLENNPEYLPTFRDLGQAADVTEDTFMRLEQFACCMYGKERYTDVNKLRYDLFTQKYQAKAGNVLTSYDGIDLSLLPPCRASLRMHIKRANYQALVWNTAHDNFPDIPSPFGHGWTKDEHGSLEYQWTEGDILPQELADIVSDYASCDDDDDDYDVLYSLMEEVLEIHVQTTVLRFCLGPLAYCLCGTM